MPVIAVNEGDALDLPRLLGAAAELPPGAPVVVMTHGYRYSPSTPARDPHRHILAPYPGRHRRGTPSWPARLGLRGARGLGVAFGWEAGGSFWRAHARSTEAAVSLGRLLAALAATGRPLHLVAHSLGARAALLALGRAPGAGVARAILLAPASARAEAEAALLAAPGTEVVSVTTRANRAFDALYRAALPHHGPTLGTGLAPGPALGLATGRWSGRDRAGSHPRWLDLRLDDPATAALLARLGLPVRPERRAVCHWGSYLRPGVWPLYRALLDPGRTPLALLRPPAPVAAPLAPWPARAILPAHRDPGATPHASPHRASLLAHPQRA